MFKIRDLGVLAYNNGFTQWHYSTQGEPLGTVLAPGFFEACSDMFGIGDHIHVNAGRHGGAILCVTATSPSVVAQPMVALSIPKAAP